ncbi:MAG: hypothetical protein IGS38_14585 [Synechococcales cyanobacterium M58_A2018_015]|nr:hypothetical protein [Synechococcales cyanobacterium M58_A2018_015]MBF2026962.1 hypothetical protein [Leptolyngbyaceae cyanobacterium C42_A2020_001]
MKIELVPLLQLQRDLYTIPRGQERFRTYLETIINTDGFDLEVPPLVVMNPMGKDHIAGLLDALLAIEADAVAARAISEVIDQFEDVSGQFKLGLVVVDDQMGGWANRYTSEFSFRFETQQSLKRGWLSGVLWTSEVPSAQKVREAVLTALYRAVYIQQNGFAHTLEKMLEKDMRWQWQAAPSSIVLRTTSPTPVKSSLLTSHLKIIRQF